MYSSLPCVVIKKSAGFQWHGFVDSRVIDMVLDVISSFLQRDSWCPYVFFKWPLLQDAPKIYVRITSELAKESPGFSQIALVYIFLCHMCSPVHFGEVGAQFGICILNHCETRC